MGEGTQFPTGPSGLPDHQKGPGADYVMVPIDEKGLQGMRLGAFRGTLCCLLSAVLPQKSPPAGPTNGVSVRTFVSLAAPKRL